MHRLIVPLAVVLALPAFARDALPLRHGFYVQEPTPCAQASNATLRLFDGRHELLNEVNRDEVMSFIVTWMLDRFGASE